MKKVQVILLLVVLFVGFSFTKNIISNKYVYGDNDATTLIVNEENPLDSRFIPDNLQKINISFVKDVEDSKKRMTKEAKEYLEKLIADANSKNIVLIGKSAYVSYAQKYKEYYMEVLEIGSDEADKLVTKPGLDEHQTGLCIDLTNEKNNISKDSDEYKWLQKNAHNYGFIIRDCKEKNAIHLRYVGLDSAKYIYENNLTLEAYIGENVT